jgi:hypothetical protein
VGDRDFRRLLIDWDFGAPGWWFDNRAYYHEQSSLMAGPEREARHEAGLELARISPDTRAALQRWNELGEQLIGRGEPTDVQDKLPAFYAEKGRLAELVANELGPGWTVFWEDAAGVEHECTGGADTST